MFLFYTVVLIVTGFRGVNGGGVYMKPTSLDYGDVYNSTNPSRATRVNSKAECALSCDSLGGEMCQSFNFKQSGEEMRCEMFDHLPVNMDSLVSSPGDQFYEKQCEPLYVTSSMKLFLNNGRFVGLMVDENSHVYQVNSEFLKPRFIGLVPDVFIGYTLKIHDLIFGHFHPFSRATILRNGMAFYCFQEEDESYTKFKECDAPEGYFPRHFTDLFGSNIQESQDLSLIVTNDNTLAIGIWKSPSKVSLYEYDNGGHGLTLESKRTIQCSDDPPDSFCKYVDFWESGQCAIVLGFATEIFGLFVDRRFYVYDYVNGTVVGRYPVCLDREALFFV